MLSATLKGPVQLFVCGIGCYPYLTNRPTNSLLQSAQQAVSVPLYSTSTRPWLQSKELHYQGRGNPTLTKLQNFRSSLELTTGHLSVKPYTTVRKVSTCNACHCATVFSHVHANNCHLSNGCVTLSGMFSHAATNPYMHCPRLRPIGAVNNRLVAMPALGVKCTLLKQL